MQNANLSPRILGDTKQTLESIKISILRALKRCELQRDLKDDLTKILHLNLLSPRIAPQF